MAGLGDRRDRTASRETATPTRVASDGALKGGRGRVPNWAICAACLLLATLLLGAPGAHASSGPAAPGDVSDRVAQARALIDTPRGETLLDLLGDPAVRERLMAAPTAPPPAAPPAAAMSGSMGFMLDRVLGHTRQRIIDLGTQLRALPDALRTCWGRVSTTMPASDTLDMLIYLVAFVAGGIAAQRLFLFAARPWLAHFDRLNVETLAHRLAVPVGLYVLRNAAAQVTRGQWLANAEEVSPVSAIADRCMQALVVVAAAFALIEIWQIDMSSVTGSETAMTRLGRGAFEALVIFLGADLL